MHKRDTSYSFHRRNRKREGPATPSTFEYDRVVEMLVFAPYIGAPIPPHREPSGLTSSSGWRIVFDGQPIGYIWEEWVWVEGHRISVYCRQLAESALVTRSKAAREEIGFALAAEWKATRD